MKNPFCIATGNLWRAKLSPLEAILHLSRFEIDGIELTVGQIDELLNFSLPDKAIGLLLKYKHNSLHSPCHIVTGAKDDQEIAKEITILNRLYKQTNARTMVIHPKQLIKSEFFRKFKGHICAENMTPKHKLKISDYDKILKKFPKMGFCLDVSHAYLVHPNETKNLVSAFRNRITQVHFSGAYRRREHSSILPASPRFIKSIQPIKELNVPIVLEGDIRSGQPKDLWKEIKAIKEVINNL